MRTTVLALIAATLVFVTGCEKSAPTCAAAVDNLSTLAKKQSGDVPAARAKQLVQVCEDQNWDPKTRRCVRSAESPESAQACLRDDN